MFHYEIQNVVIWMCFCMCTAFCSKADTRPGNLVSLCPETVQHSDSPGGKGRATERPHTHH